MVYATQIIVVILVLICATNPDFGRGVLDKRLTWTLLADPVIHDNFMDRTILMLGDTSFKFMSYKLTTTLNLTEAGHLD